MKNFSIFLFGISLISISCSPNDNNTYQSSDSNEPMVVVNPTVSEDHLTKENQLINIGFYNVENLFDTKDDATTEDEWFLPSSETNWTQDKYEKKLDHLAEVIDALNSEKGGPDILGLCEVENKNVVKDLISSSQIEKSNYEIVHYESPDTRGIDVAAVFNSNKFNLMDSRSIFVEMPENPDIKTRDILYCKLQAKHNDEIIHFYVNHWSSRRKGEQETFFKRKNCAQTLLYDIENNIEDWKNQNIIIVGDMNDYPDNKSIYDVLGAKEVNSNAELLNLQYNNHMNGKGTYNHKGEWGCLDNFIISDELEDNCTKTDATILKKDWMLYTNKYGESFPSKTYGGTNYYGGYSDHLPVFVEIIF